MARAPQVMMVFVDGLGLGPDQPQVNPLYRGDCPCLARWLREEAVPVDACLGVDGLPQSATGQTALFTGRNAAAELGRHKEGFPGPKLRALIRRHNAFRQLDDRGYLCAFANAYCLGGMTPSQMRRRRSVTTVMTMQALGGVRTGEHLRRGEAVYNDLTRERAVRRGYRGGAVTPRQAGRDLLRLARRYDFTLFEYFLTDHAGHKGTDFEVRRVLRELDAFLEVAGSFARHSGRLFLLVSDHGNLEDASTRSHTRNPVPLVALGTWAEAVRERVRRLDDLVPALLELFPRRTVSRGAAPDDRLAALTL